MELAQETALSYKSVLYHLHLLETVKIIERLGKKPYYWELTGIGQQFLTAMSSKL